MDNMNRREFIRKAAECTACAAVGVTIPNLFPGKAEGSQNPDIVVANGAPGPAVRAAIDSLGGMQHFVKRGDRVVIKPNMSFPNPPSWATTTHPEVIRELGRLCHGAGASSILVLDNPLRNAALCLKRTGIKSALKEVPGARVEALEDEGFYREVEVSGGLELKTTMIMKQVLEADVLIAAPVAKSHSATGLSFAMKGMMGLIHNRREFHLDLDLNKAVVDLCTVLRPKLTVIDASRILSSGGPGGPGKVLPLNKIICSEDMVAADATATELGTWYGRKFKARQVKHILMAHNRGLGNMEIKQQVVKEVAAP
jgi:uncharacterized protein (DUF362 family)